MKPIHQTLLTVLVAVLSACASLPAARMVLPEPLSAIPAITIDGLGAGRSGEFALADQRGRFERGADRLTVFDSLVFHRISARYSSPRTSAACRGRSTGGTLGVISGSLRAFEVQCQYEGAFAGALTLRGNTGAAGTQQQRSGRLVAGGVAMDVASVHRLQGSPLPLPFPAGYVFTVEGRPVGALALTDTQPRVWLPPACSPLHDASVQAALTLALLWDPSQGQE